ncbi:uncharacterized protein Bfra_006468 [Botrytis fragariae]|uniref:DUF7730 domain-containing protein n=1 Tax=Botrytis fragariae TaxID=1964551 RepID=A0A8H6B4H4_9HELO|nr:uncharacterized protein Bfra_006468 [Botrytis fragariae]KAF5879263.1 hypothetical protein Bfra_006468 [Botrytis fragariae]
MTSKKEIEPRVKALIILLAVVCFPITFFVLYGQRGQGNFDRLRKAQRKEIAKARKRKIEDQPKPLEERRKRELSLEPTGRRRDLANVFSTWKRNRKTPASLLQLPPEIVEKILLEVLGHVRCKEPHDIEHAANSQYDIERSCILSAQRRKYLTSEWMRHYNQRPSPFYTRSDSCLAVLLTCRRVYNQGIPILYSCNTFDINNPETLLYLSQTVISSRFKSIKSLQIDVNASMGSSINTRLADPTVEFSEWKMCLEMLERLEGLQNLRLRVEFELQGHYPNVIYSDEQLQKSLQDLLDAIKLSSLRGLRRFDLETNSRDIKGVEQTVESVRGIVCT